ncbi:MAG: type II toxin-antitoxin system VapC family toxin [Coriobacteriia bacterium]|nr:type II toxin-antitoxin system VapC family toxin [Coriobacteriia bacterium]
MAVLIDASILIEAERGWLDVEPHVARRADEESFLSVITASELLHGVHRAARPDQRARRSAFVEGVLERFPLLEVDLPTARAHAQVWADLSAAGTLIGPHDLWLAAACIAHGLTMVTANVREFERVPGLQVETWSDV